MARFAVLVSLTTLFLVTLAVHAQTATPVRDAAAIATLNQATEALQGPSVLAKVSSALCIGSIQAVSGTGIKSGTFTWEHQFSATGFRFRSEFQSDGTDQVFAFGDTGTSVSANGKVSSMPAHMSRALLPFHLPAVVLNMFLANPQYSVTALPQVQVRGVTTNHVLVSLNTDAVTQAVTPEDWYFDSSTGLPLRVEFRLPDQTNALSYTKAAADFANYQAVDGILVPFLIGNTEDGVVNSTVIIKSVQWNYAVSPSDFALKGAAQ